MDQPRRSWRSPSLSPRAPHRPRTLRTSPPPPTTASARSTRTMSRPSPIADDGTVDWPTFSGYRRYHADCHVCHGPDGEGSSYAPALKDLAMRMDYYDFIGIVASGRQRSGRPRTR